MNPFTQVHHAPVRPRPEVAEAVALAILLSAVEES